MDSRAGNETGLAARVNAHDPEYRRAFRLGKRIFSHRGFFSIVRMADGSLFPLPIVYDTRAEEPGNGVYVEIITAYWNPEGTRWRRFDPEKELKKMQEGNVK